MRESDVNEGGGGEEGRNGGQGKVGEVGEKWVIEMYAGWRFLITNDFQKAS